MAEFARQRIAELERRYLPIGRGRRAGRPRPGAGRGAVRRRLRRQPVAAPAAGGGEQLCQHHCPVAHVAARVPAAVRGRDRGLRAPARHPCAAAGHDRPRRRRLHHARHGAVLVSTATRQPRPEESPHDHYRPPRSSRASDRYKFGWSDSDAAGATAKRGLTEDVVRDISAKKNEPEWMLELRLKGLQAVREASPCRPGARTCPGIDFDNIKYFVRSTEKQAATWDDLPADIKNTYDKLGIPEAEKQRLVAGVAAQYESEVVYHQIREDLEEQGVIFLDTDTALREHPELFQEYFATVIPAGDNKFSALNTAVWSGGSFIYVPKGVHVDIPLQAYFRINTENMGQFERTLIIVDEDAYVHYVEGCTAPIYSLRLAALGRGRDHREEGRPLPLHDHPELVEQRLQPGHQAGRGAGGRDHGVGRRQHRLQGHDEVPGRLADGRARQGRDAVDRLRRRRASTRTPAPRWCTARRTPPRASSPSRWRAAAAARPTAAWCRSSEGAHHSKSTVKCDALLVDTISRSDTYPYVDVREDDVSMGHEATVSKVSDDQLFYLMSRGMTEDEAMAMIVRGFVEPIARELPMEYALELNRLIELQMEGAVG